MSEMAMPWSWGGFPRTQPTGGGRKVSRGEAPESGDQRGREPRRRGRRGGRRERGPGAWGHMMAMGGSGGGFPPHPPTPPLPPHMPWGGGQIPHGHPMERMFGRGRDRGRRGGPRARRGDVRTGILLLLAEEPRSGYEIIREGKERSSGAWRPSPGSVYPMLQQLEDEGLVRPAEASGGGRRRPFELTEEGHAYVEDNAGDLTPPWEAVHAEYEDAQARYTEMGHLAYQLTAAAAQVAEAGTPEQLERAKRLLSDTKRGLYRILAEDDAAAAADAAAEDGDADGTDDLR
ncbi:DNA-binding PadR family transcriptional regulator [Nocardiopsis mwathae]|uniref:DNA-binding PadR family transcriptional regulator n=1 Tax=Nocardiopsis mwathae TaxID=1472723 RepID=A0A7X0D6S1_9ACTN|nr:PadR family transcriptional regulator [Nocardiopsis mwathae]MBB6172399.1 DNA-binding PadR family transcriptional regulator [Nocardiopsis mwathae]